MVETHLSQAITVGLYLEMVHKQHVTFICFFVAYDHQHPLRTSLVRLLQHMFQGAIALVHQVLGKPTLFVWLSVWAILLCHDHNVPWLDFVCSLFSVERSLVLPVQDDCLRLADWFVFADSLNVVPDCILCLPLVCFVNQAGPSSHRHRL